jgi:toxin-antitoxin system PIN domain toxin
MIAVDTNVLVYAHRREAREHAVAYRLLKTLAEGSAPWALPRPCVYEFFSVVTNRKIWHDRASSPAQAWQQIDAWLGSPTVRLLGETPDFPSVLETLATRPRVRGAIIHDARIAAICLAHGVEALLTRDRDFSLFPELVQRDPFRQDSGLSRG